MFARQGLGFAPIPPRRTDLGRFGNCIGGTTQGSLTTDYAALLIDTAIDPFFSRDEKGLGYKPVPPRRTDPRRSYLTESFYQVFYNNQFPQKSVNLSFIITN